MLVEITNGGDDGTKQLDEVVEECVTFGVQENAVRAAYMGRVTTGLVKNKFGKQSGSTYVKIDKKAHGKALDSAIAAVEKLKPTLKPMQNKIAVWEFTDECKRYDELMVRGALRVLGRLTHEFTIEYEDAYDEEFLVFKTELSLGSLD